MATTCIDSYKTAARKSVLQTLTELFRYGQRYNKTRDGELVSADECDPKTAHRYSREAVRFSASSVLYYGKIYACLLVEIVSLIHLRVTFPIP